MINKTYNKTSDFCGNIFHMLRALEMFNAFK